MSPQTLQAHLEHAQALRLSPGQIGWFASDLQGKQILSHNPDRRFLAASTIKLPLLMHYAQQRHLSSFQAPYLWQASDHVEDSPFFEAAGEKAGQAGAEPSISWDTLAEWMMIRSDNAATNLLIRKLELSETAAFIQQLPVPLPQTVLARLMMDAEARAAGRENWTSPQDMALLMQALVQGKCLDATATHWVMDILFRCEDPEKIPFLFRPPIEVANKPGELPGLRADVAYIRNRIQPPSDQAAVMAIFCDGVPPEHEEACDQWQAELAQILWELLWP